MTDPAPKLSDCTAKANPSARLFFVPLSGILTATRTTRLVIGHRGDSWEFTKIAA